MTSTLIRNAFLAILCIALIAGPASAGITFRTFDSDILGTVLGSVVVDRDVLRSAPGSASLLGSPGLPARLDLPINLPCGLGAILDMRFRLDEAVPAQALVEIATLATSNGPVARLWANAGETIKLGSPAAPSLATVIGNAQPGSWHSLHVEIRGNSILASLDAGSVTSSAAERAEIPTLLTHRVTTDTSQVRLRIDDVRVIPIIERFADSFETTSWNNIGGSEDGEVVEVSTAEFYSAPSSMHVRSVDHSSYAAVGIWHEFSLPTCALSRILGVGSTVWFNLPEQPAWGDAEFILAEFTDAATSYPEVHFRIGDADGDRLLEIEYDDPAKIGREPNIGTVYRFETSTPIPFGGWHKIDVDIRPVESLLSMVAYNGLFSLPLESLALDVVLDGISVGRFPVGSSTLPAAAYLGTVSTRPWLSDDFEGYFDDFRVRIELGAPLCGDGEKIFASDLATLTFDAAWLSGESADAGRFIRIGADSFAVGPTGVVPVELPEEGALDAVYRLTTSTGLVLDEVCRIVRDTVPPLLSAQPIPAPSAGWWAKDSKIRVAASDAGSGVGSLEMRIDSGSWVAIAGGGSDVAVPEGEHDFEFRATDRAQHLATALVHTRKDSTPPSVMIDSPHRGDVVLPGNIAINSGQEFVLAPLGDLTISGRATDQQSGLQSVLIYVDGALKGPATGLSDWTTTLELPAGRHEVRISATDWAGLTASRAFSVIVAASGSLA